MSAAPFLSSSWYRVARRRPKLRDHTSVHRHRYRGNIWYVVHDHATGGVHRLSPAGYMIVAAMDGASTVDQLWREAGTRLEEEAPSQDEVIQLLTQLNAADLLQTEVAPDAATLVERAARAGQSRWLSNVLNPLALRIPLWHPDKFLESSRSFAAWLFGWPGTLLWLLAVLPAMLLAAQHWQELSASVSDRILAADNVVLLALTYFVLKALHEFGHGFAVKAFGGGVHEFGVMFLVFFAVALCRRLSGIGVPKQMAACARRRRRNDSRDLLCRAFAIRVARSRTRACSCDCLRRDGGRRRFDGSVQRQPAPAL